MSDLVIVGAGGHGRETLDIVEALNMQDSSRPWNFLGFADDGKVDEHLLRRRGATHLGPVQSSISAGAQYVLGIGSSAIRQYLDASLLDQSAATLIHPGASVASDNRFAPGVLIAVGAVVTTNVTLGRHTHLNVASIVSHDCVVGDYVTISPGVRLNGNVRVESGAFFGTGAVVTPGCVIGANATIGAGAVVIGDVAPGTTVVGVPARIRP